ncbi:MAG: hypothetical protein Q9162_006349 [Coniocarpon cinnabarinum]
MRSWYDYVVGGSGLTGCALASRLKSADPSAQVAIIEAGPDASSNPLTKSPLGAFMLEQSDLDWFYKTEPQKGLHNRTIREINGRVLGGGSILNYGGWSRGDAAGYELWARNFNDERWSYSGLLPYFKRSEHYFDQSNKAAHGYNGPHYVYSVSASDSQRKYPLREAMKRAFFEQGASFAIDDGSTHLGLWEMVENWKDGNRQSCNIAYDLDGVDIITETLVHKVITSAPKTGDSQPRAIGIKLVDGRVISASKDIILSSRTYRSPQLLILSSISLLEDLVAHGIEVVSHLLVGKNLFDHMSVW